MIVSQSSSSSAVFCNGTLSGLVQSWNEIQARLGRREISSRYLARWAWFSHYSTCTGGKREGFQLKMMVH